VVVAVERKGGEERERARERERDEREERKEKVIAALALVWAGERGSCVHPSSPSRS